MRSKRPAPTARRVAATAVLGVVLSGVATATTATTATVAAPSTTARAQIHDGPEVVADPGPRGGPTAGRRTPLRGESRIAGRPADVLSLHSDPTAERTIYLDLDGAEVRGTAWNAGGLAPGAVGGFDPGLDGPGLNAAEADVVYEVWQRIAEDYAPFRVDVTTATPTAAALDRTGAADTRFGARLLITDDTRPRQQIQGCDGLCGGIAQLGVFALTSQHRAYQTAFVFSSVMRPASLASDIANAGSHELGHVLGLSHDDKRGDSFDGYYEGHDPWGPIMGAVYDQPVVQWSKGSFRGSTNTEDDLYLLRAGGIPLRRDDVGQTASTALDYPARTTGVVTTAKDVDLFRLRGCSGTVTVDVAVASYGANLDVASKLFTADLTLVGRHDDPVTTIDATRASGLGVRYSETLPSAPATYYVSVDGVGKAGTTPTTGYDDYGSLGRYTLSVTGCGQVVAGLPGAPSAVTAQGRRGGAVALGWAPPAVDGGSLRSGYEIYVGGVLRQRVAPGTTSTVVTGLTPGSTYRFAISAVNDAGAGSRAAILASAPAVPPAAPALGRVRSGAPGGTVTAYVAWTAPSYDGGAGVIGYRVVCQRLDRSGRVVRTQRTGELPPSSRSANVNGLAAGRYRLAVQARNATGWGAVSGRSAVVRAR